MAHKKGVLTGCEKSQEWMLKWWWENYSKHNSYPVTFVDFGMSLAAREWCKNKGSIITISPPTLNSSNNAPWSEKVPGYVWNHRKIWFCKPTSYLLTPYETTIWTDIDCQVQKDLSPLYSFADSPDGFAISYDTPKNQNAFRRCYALKPDVIGVQAGVLSFKKNSPVIVAWEKYCKTHHHEEYSEQSALSHLVHKYRFNITLFSSQYNWLQSEGDNPHATILHHAGAFSKRRLLSQVPLR